MTILLLFVTVASVPLSIFIVARGTKDSRATKEALYEHVVKPLAERDPASRWAELSRAQQGFRRRRVRVP